MTIVDRINDKTRKPCICGAKMYPGRKIRAVLNDKGKAKKHYCSDVCVEEAIHRGIV